jgi:hypothetical protein
MWAGKKSAQVWVDGSCWLGITMEMGCDFIQVWFCDVTVCVKSNDDKEKLIALSVATPVSSFIIMAFSVARRSQMSLYWH